MAVEFNIIEYLSGLTGFVFDKSVLVRIATERRVLDVTSYDEMTKQTRDLLLADLLCTAYYSPNIWASYTHSHGSYSQTIGSQSLNTADKERIYNMFMNIYRKDDDEMLDQAAEENTLEWLDF